MRRGPWHQCGDRSQVLAAEQLEKGVGVGVVISPRDLALHKAVEHAAKYHGLGAHVLIDQQFYIPDAMIGKLNTYPICQFRDTVSQLHPIGDADLANLANELQSVNQQVGADGIVAPAVVYEAGRPEIIELNSRLFTAARAVGNALGRPVYATVVLGSSVTSTIATILDALSHATALDADGYYFAFEFGDERIPSSREAVFRCGLATLTLACSGRPVFHAYAGPMGLLSHGFGASAVGIGHSQNLWQFDRSRWEAQDGQGGGGDAPPRVFSTSLWGTIIHPDETAQLSPALRDQVCTPSPFSSSTTISKWDANKHLVYLIGSTVAAIAATNAPRTNAQTAIELLQAADALHTAIRATNLKLKDRTDSYQANWRDAMSDLLAQRSSDFDYLDLLS